MNSRKYIALRMGGGGNAASYTEFADSFARSDGAVGNNWTGATWTIATEKLVNTPNLGAEDLADGGLESWVDANNLTDWTEYSPTAATYNQDASDKHGGDYSLRIDVNSGFAFIEQALAPASTWMYAQWFAKCPANQAQYAFINNALPVAPNLQGTAAWQEYFSTLRTGAVYKSVRFSRVTSAAYSLYFDDLSVKPLTAAELFLTRPVYATADYLLELTLTAHERGTLQGIAFAIDNPANPQNYGLMTHNGAEIRVWKVVNNVISSVGSKTQVFAANDKFTLAKLGNQVRAYCNDVAIADAYTIDDATVKDNLYAGIFSVHSNNLPDTWSEQVRTVGGGDAFLMPFFNSEIYPVQPVYATADYLLEVTINSLRTGTLAGLAFGLDSASNPQNYMLAYTTGSQVVVKKCVAGVLTTLTTKTQSFAAGDVITVAKLGAQVNVLYNDIAIAPLYTADDAIKDNLYAGKYSTYTGNSIAWSETVKEVGGSTAFIDAYFVADDGLVFPIGDSITVGATDEVTGTGYPIILVSSIALDTKGYWAESPTRFASGGWTVQTVKDGIDAALAARSTTPDHILIYLGANDCVNPNWSDFDETLWKANYNYILAACHTKWPGAKIYLGKSYRYAADANLATLAGWIDDLVLENSTFCYAGVDGWAIFDGHPELRALDGADPTHPNHAGFIALANGNKVILGY